MKTYIKYNKPYDVEGMSHLELGRYGEKIGRDFLEFNNYTILKTNLRTKFGEIDIVAKKDNVLAVVEVKTRRTKSYGLPCEAVSRQKQQHIKGSLNWYLQQIAGAYTYDIRFDVIEVYVEKQISRVRHLEGCFM
ncbi:YraN family protein [Veillonella sp.]|uniref:YraN family protein n=1 Tax=Veillonella sp. TaxID=1926307 RepID=UPI0025D0AD0C|nr:YraN family protein [Veillonella sp.]